MKLRSRKNLLILVVLLFLTAILPVNSYAEIADPEDVQFWKLYEQAENYKNEGKTKSAIQAWYNIIQLYEGEDSKRANTRRAVYWAEIAGAYEKLELYHSASKAYGETARNWEALGQYESALWPRKFQALYRTELELYTKSTDTRVSTGSGNSSKFEPESGAYLGGTFVLDPLIGYKMENIDNVYGRKHNLLVYLHWSGKEYVPSWAVKYVKQTGLPIQIALEPDMGLDEVREDGYLLSLAKNLRDLGAPVFLRYASEMNQDGYAWYGNPSKYIEKFRLVTKVMRENAPNVAMVWSPNYVPTDIMKDYYPGDEWVDWVGIDSYLHYFPLYAAADSPGLQAEYSEGIAGDPLDKLKFIYDEYSDRKPIFISETGIQNYQPVKDIRVFEWSNYKLRYLYSYLPLKYPRIKAIFYYNNMYGKGSTANYGLSLDKEIMSTYTDIVKDHYYINSPQDTVGYSYQVLDNIALDVSGKVTIRPYIRLPYLRATSLKAYLNGELISESGILPFEFDIDTSRISTTQDNSLLVEAWSGAVKEAAVSYKLSRAADGKIYSVKTNTEIIAEDNMLNSGQNETSNGIRVFVNGKRLQFDTQPYVKNGRVMVPMSKIFSELGAAVTWDGGTGSVTAVRGSDNIIIRIGSSQAVLNGQSKAIDENSPDVVPEIVPPGRTMVPVRFVSESLGAQVLWDGATSTVIIQR